MATDGGDRRGVGSFVGVWTGFASEVPSGSSSKHRFANPVRAEAPCRTCARVDRAARCFGALGRPENGPTIEQNQRNHWMRAANDGLACKKRRLCGGLQSKRRLSKLCLARQELLPILESTIQASEFLPRTLQLPSFFLCGSRGSGTCTVFSQCVIRWECRKTFHLACRLFSVGNK